MVKKIHCNQWFILHSQETQFDLDLQKYINSLGISLAFTIPNIILYQRMMSLKKCNDAVESEGLPL